MAPNDVKASLNYTCDDGTRPYYYGYVREGKKSGEVDIGGTKSIKEVQIRDARGVDVDLDRHAFQLVEHDTAFSTEDFYGDNEKIVKNYYPEIAECIKNSTGAEYVQCFHHQVRNKDRNNGGPNNVVTSVQGYADGIHSDSHPETADATWTMFCSMGLEKRFRRGRYLYINAWRNISDEPIENNHLAVLDQTSLTEGVGSEDYIESDFHGYEATVDYYYSVKQFVLNEKNSENHRWYYYPRMRKNEVLLFKQWDSDPQRSNICFHTAFTDPTASPTALTRQSIEVRAFAYFPDHEPNTCPGTKLIYPIKAFFVLMFLRKKLKENKGKVALVTVGAAVGIAAVVYAAKRFFKNFIGN